MTACAAALGWLGWQWLDQDRAVERQRRRERLENAATGIAGALQLAITNGQARVRIASGSVSVDPPGALAFLPLHSSSPAASPVFTEAETAEFSGRRTEAAALYRKLAGKGEPACRAEALVRLGRVLRLDRRLPEALETYRQLEQCGDTAVAGMPARLIARGARCSILAETGQRPALATAARSLWDDLTHGRIPVNRQTLETYLAEIRAWLPTAPLPADWPERMVMAEALARSLPDRERASGRLFLDIDGHPASVSWEPRDGAWQAAIAGSSFWRKTWAALERHFQVRLRLATTGGQLLHGPDSLPAESSFPAPSAISLPLQVAIIPAFDTSAPESGRRRIMLAGLIVLGLLLIGGTLIIGRAINREIAVARLQTDFVAAVSHEFRTPLTSIRQLTELLARGRMRDEAQVHKAYEHMMNESDRLKRLVDSILDFGRMRSGAYQFRFESTSAAEWARSVVDEFHQACPATDLSLSFRDGDSGACISADREALRGALWNLLDNAVKYSPDSKQVTVEVEELSSQVAIRVSDRGMGIPRDELLRLFDRFYRSESARAAGAKGTGIGLALVKEIVEAHGGAVRAESEVGRGSTFTILLPREKTA
jgi:signal transduction histidine kinase